MLFSQRQGITPSLKDLQIEDIDADLRNRLWNVVLNTVLIGFSEGKGARVYGYLPGSNKSSMFNILWSRFFKLPTDTIPTDYDKAKTKLRDWYFASPWFKVYDFIDFVAAELTPQYVPEHFSKVCNSVLESENSAYRLVAGRVSPITSPVEIEEVEESLRLADSFPGVSQHISASVRLFTDRDGPDYRNSIKESISAVESACRALTGEPKATLGDALRVLERESNVHPALKQGMSKLYGYTSDEGGIRHAMLEEPTVTFADAKFMLVACSGFVNYLLGKVAESEIDLPSLPES